MTRHEHKIFDMISRTLTALALALAVALPLAASAQSKPAASPGKPAAAPTNPAAAAGNALQGIAVPVDPAPPGTVPWQLLQQAKTVQKSDRKFGPVFTREIKDLDKRDVKLYGFMMPLDQARKQKRFLLAAFPPHCAFCLPAGPESIVEVIADRPIEFTYEPIVVAGRMAVLDNDVVYYRLSNATAVQP